MKYPQKQFNVLIHLLKQLYDFLLYPEGCNDSHIITAIKQAFKHMGL